MKKLSILAILLVGLLALIGCSGEEVYTLTVMVEDIDGVEIEDAEVTVDGETETGSSVQFDLDEGVYQVEASAEGYSTETERVVVDGDKSITMELSLATEVDEFVLITSEEDGETDIFIDWDHDLDDGNIAYDYWDTATEYDPDSKYEGKAAWELIPGDGWARPVAVLAFMGDIYDEAASLQKEFPIELSAESEISFSVASKGELGTLKLELVTGTGNDDVIITDVEDSEDGWQDVTIPASWFSGVSLSNINQMAIVADGATDAVYVTDYKVSNVNVVVPK